MSRPEGSSADVTSASVEAIVASGLVRRVGGFTILHEVDLSVNRGEFLSIIGPNGAGKSTLINVLSGVDELASGVVQIDGVDVSREGPASRARRGMGRTFQTSSLFLGLTVQENVRLAVRGHRGSLTLWRLPSRRDGADRRAGDILERVGLGPRSSARAADLSHGDKRRLELAIVLGCDPHLILLDEPTAGVSAEQVDDFMDVVKSLHAEGRTVVMVEHNMDLVLSMSDRIGVMHQGEMLIVDKPDVVMKNEVVREAYLGGGI